jgi:hypothetical protein
MMPHTLKGGLLIGILCGVWMFIVGFTGWYKDPVLQSTFWVVILIEVGVLFWALRRMPADQRTFGRLLKDGTIMSVIGGLVLIIASVLFTTVVFPNYFEELRTIQAEMLRAEGMNEEQIAAAHGAMAPMQTPVVNALMGFVGTVVTGFVASVVIGLFLKKKVA